MVGWSELVLSAQMEMKVCKVGSEERAGSNSLTEVSQQM